jgi:SagB-type dehydrogenase family enzyme
VTRISLIARWRTDSDVDTGLAASMRPEVNLEFSQRLKAGIDLHVATERERRGLERLQGLALLEWTVGTELIARPLSRDLSLPVLPESSLTKQLSSWVMLRPASGTWILESASAPWQLSDARGLHHNIDGSTWSESEWSLASAIGMTAATDDPELARTWNFHDRLFAMRSRRDALQPLSPMLRGDSSPPPLHRVPASAGPNRITLPAEFGPRPDEPTLFDAMESRRKMRKFSDTPVEIDDLAELLWRSVRIRERTVGRMPGYHDYEAALGPVPSGGALRAIDTWVATPGVAGLSSAWWWYDPLSHELVHVRELSANAETPPVCLRFTVRHARTSWKYPGFAHALELKDMGVIMLAMQLAAAPIGLGVWILGTGPTTSFAEELGIDPRTDHPVGEIMLGYTLKPDAVGEDS